MEKSEKQNESSAGVGAFENMARLGYAAFCLEDSSSFRDEILAGAKSWRQMRLCFVLVYRWNLLEGRIGGLIE